MTQTDTVGATLRDPVDSAALVESGWLCPICTVSQTMDSTYCQMCLYSRPMDRRGVPQIFAGYAIHFNGIIPRTVIHPSHTVEWRIAERHGAICMVKFDPTTVNLLVYRPGYERSDKVRACVEKYTQIPAVPISWMLDSLLQSRQIHPALYRLTYIPAVAKVSVRDSDLPHHQHPFYQLNFEDYAIPTSFPLSKRNKKQSARNNATIKREGLPAGLDVNVPPFFDIYPLHYTNVNVFDAASACISGKNRDDVDDENDEVEERAGKAKIELIAYQQSANRIDKMLFSGIRVVLSPALEKEEIIVNVLRSCGAVVVKSTSNMDTLLRSEATHVVYAQEDKKCDLMISAASVINDLPGLQMAHVSWIEDCLILGELIPLYGMYVPTAKLLETLNKKYKKRM